MRDFDVREGGKKRINVHAPVFLRIITQCQMLLCDIQAWLDLVYFIAWSARATEYGEHIFVSDNNTFITMAPS